MNDKYYILVTAFSGLPINSIKKHFHRYKNSEIGDHGRTAGSSNQIIEISENLNSLNYLNLKILYTTNSSKNYDFEYMGKAFPNLKISRFSLKKDIEKSLNKFYPPNIVKISNITLCKFTDPNKDLSCLCEWGNEFLNCCDFSDRYIMGSEDRTKT
jgi:hypothetical protein